MKSKKAASHGSLLHSGKLKLQNKIKFSVDAGQAIPWRADMGGGG